MLERSAYEIVTVLGAPLQRATRRFGQRYVVGVKHLLNEVLEGNVVVGIAKEGNFGTRVTIGFFLLLLLVAVSAKGLGCAGDKGNGCIGDFIGIATFEGVGCLLYGIQCSQFAVRLSALLVV